MTNPTNGLLRHVRVRHTPAVATVMFMFFAYFWLILTRGYESDIRSHLILSTYCQSHACLQLPHKGFSQALTLSYSVLDVAGAAPIAEALAAPAIHTMSAAFAGDIAILMRRGTIDTPDVLADYHFALLHLSAALLLAFFVAANFYVIFLLIKVTVAARLKDGVCFALSLITILVSAIYVPWFSGFVYFGQWGPNSWHSPTTLMLRPLANLGFFLCATCFVSTNAPPKRLVAFFAAVLLASTWVKPSFAITIIPALACFLIVTRPQSLKPWFSALAAALPTMLLIAAQTRSTYGVAAKVQSSIVVDFAAVWSQYTPSILVSILLGLAFPLVSLIKHVVQAPPRWTFLAFAWLLVMVALIEGLLLAETGPRRMDGNLLWGYAISMQVVFVFSVAEFARICLAPRVDLHPIAHTVPSLRGVALSEGPPGLRRQCITVAIVLLLHLLSGIYYLWRYGSVGNYH